MDDSAGLTVWNAILAGALKIPGARIDRASFLRSALTAQVSADVVEKAVATTPAKAGISKTVIKKAAQSSIAWHRAGVSANGMDFLLTWNCAHIANATMRPRIEAICRANSFEPPVICRFAEEGAPPREPSGRARALLYALRRSC
jgi:hypothetical protein